MKKLGMIFLALLSSGMAYALPLGNPSEASLLCDGVFCEGWCPLPCQFCLNWYKGWSLRVGYYGDFVFNRHMEVDREHDHSDIHETQITTNAGYIAVNFCDRYDLFGVVGASNIWLRTPRSAFKTHGVAPPNNNEFIYLETETQVSWGLGARASLWRCGCFTLGLEGQYFSMCPDIDFVRDEESDPFYFSNAQVHLSEWQLGLGVSYRINIYDCVTALVPYIGIKVSHAHINMGEEEVAALNITLHDLNNNKYLGWALGISLVGCDKIAVTAEARWADEKALYINGQIRF